MLTRGQSAALYVAAVCSLISALILGTAVANPCRDPSPPTHPVPAAK